MCVINQFDNGNILQQKVEENEEPVESVRIIFLSGISAPPYYTSKNKRGDGHVLIGAKYIYINGYFHNWDFPLSGLTSLQPIREPFKGIQLIYYYTVRRSVQTQELRIPVPDFIDSVKLIGQIQAENV